MARGPNKSCDVKFEGLRKLLKKLFPNFEVENEKKFGRSVHEVRFRFVFVDEQYAFILMVGKQLPLLLNCSVGKNFAKITKSICLNFSIINRVYNTKLPGYTLPPTQQHIVFRNLIPSVSVC